MRSFLEHELHSRALLAEVARVLAPGGATIVKVPNHGSANRLVMGPRWCGFRSPGHVNYFTPRTLQGMVEQAGLAVVRFGPTDRFPLGDNMDGRGPQFPSGSTVPHARRPPDIGSSDPAKRSH